MKTSQLPDAVRRPHRLVPTAVAMACAMFASSAIAQVQAPVPVEASTSPAAAETPPETATSNALPTVSVTARKRNEKMLEVPISMQSLSDKELRAGGITEVKDLAAQTGFNFSSSQGSGAQGRSTGVTTFRGLQGELNFPWENSGGVFIDGIFISGGVASIGMTDVARVEVLKGPQNAFFGRSTFGGAVNFITRNPSSELGGAVNTTVDNRGSKDLDATIEGPIKTDVLNGRLSFGSRNKAAQFRATDGGALGEEETRFVSGTLYLTPTDKSWVRLRAHYQRDEDSTPATGLIPAAGNTSCQGRTYTGNDAAGNPVNFTPSVAYFCGGLPSYGTVGSRVFDANTAIPANAVAAMVDNALNEPFLAKAPKLDHTGLLREIKRVSAQGGVELPHQMDLALNAGFNESYSSSIYDVDRSKASNFLAQQSMLSKDLTVDARLSTNPRSPLRGTLGASYFRSTFQLQQIDMSMALGQTTPAIGTGNYQNVSSSVPAVYGSAEYDFNERWTLTGEARYQKDTVEFTSPAGLKTDNTAKNLLPRLTLRFKPIESMSTYISAARGVQPLSANSGYINASAAGKAYLRSLYPNISEFTEQPKLDSLELGIKQRVNPSWQYSAAIYTQTWKDRMSSTSVFNPTSCGVTVGTAACPFTASGSGVTIGNEARVTGLELAVDAQLSRQWAMGAYLDVKRAKWSRVDATNAVLTRPAVNFDGNSLARTPSVTAAANITYRYTLSDEWKAFTRGDVTFVGKRWDTDYNFFQVGSYNSFDLRQGFEKDNFSIELFVKNVFNHRGWTSASRIVDLSMTPVTNFSQQGVLVNVQDERSFGARMRYTF